MQRVFSPTTGTELDLPRTELQSRNAAAIQMTQLCNLVLVRLKELCASFGKAAQSSWKVLLSLDISNQLDVTFIKFFFHFIFATLHVSGVPCLSSGDS
jgi:hypothetical protein